MRWRRRSGYNGWQRSLRPSPTRKRLAGHLPKDGNDWSGTASIPPQSKVRATPPKDLWKRRKPEVRAVTTASKAQNPNGQGPGRHGQKKEGRRLAHHAQGPIDRRPGEAGGPGVGQAERLVQEGSQPPPAAPLGADQGQAGRGQGPGDAPLGRGERARQGPADRHGPRSLLAARLLGTQPAEHRAGPGGHGATLAPVASRPAAARSQLQRHHLVGPAAGPRHRNPRRREQLVHRRPQSPQELPGGNRLPGPGKPLLLPGAEQRRPHPQRRRRRHVRQELGRGRQGLRPHLRHERRIRRAGEPTAS